MSKDGRGVGKIYPTKEENPYFYWAKRSIDSHKYRGCHIDFEYGVLEDIARNTPTCSICGIDLDWRPDRKKSPCSPTLDRINNEREMEISNVHIVCSHCNWIKGKMSFDLFIEKCCRIGRRWRLDGKAVKKTNWI